MKEMCRNFICNNGRCQKDSANPSRAAIPEATLPDISMGDCNTCVMNRIGLAQAYIPSQTYTSAKEPEQSLICGTIFSELVMPYCSGWNLYRFMKEV